MCRQWHAKVSGINSETDWLVSLGGDLDANWVTTCEAFTIEYYLAIKEEAEDGDEARLHVTFELQARNLLQVDSIL